MLQVYTINIVWQVHYNNTANISLLVSTIVYVPQELLCTLEYLNHSLTVFCPLFLAKITS